ncbi:hypothetical protein GOP47_0013626 [Adiantum capillus-veneris]|uniref:PHD and RING finger domain-containing protein 1 n=1 Tax=Adiantum capillus-veneris TaxID=13818 RepID=A0A9D4UP41_ADICA|nr:hypothetical protein GOP47_0013626 [Adiantum capillus-veneris]
MRSTTRRRKSRKRKPSSRRKSSSRKRSRRCVSANVPSPDEDYVLESDGDESSSDSDESSADGGTEEEEEEEEVVEEEMQIDTRNETGSFDARLGASRPRQRCRRRKPYSSDEEFNVDLERDSNDDGSAGDGPSYPRSARARRDRIRNPVTGNDTDVDAKQNGFQASGPARVRHKRRKQDSSDEDFEMTAEEGLSNGSWANEGAVAKRPITRAIEAGPSDSCTGALVSYPVQLKGRSANSDALPTANSRTGEPSCSNSSSSSAREANAMDKDTAANKRKGKVKVLEGEEATGTFLAAGADVAMAAVVCGICLSETAAIERGKLDCCDHFFCFGCIMEWAKVESRCPMCKQRFATVAKAGSGVSKRTRTVRVPLRDQVYVPPEDDLPFEDPYADVICMECHGIGDEGLLLLCDRCDSAAHTFCVGLGRSVPRGDWYCRDCQALVGENSGSESEAEELVLDSDSDEEDEEFLLRSIVASESQPRRQRRVQRVPVSTSWAPARPRRRLGAAGRRIWRRLVSRSRRGRGVATAPQLSQSARAFLSSIRPELNPVANVSEVSQSGSARTVPQQRRLQERIIAMRNNWGRIQNGDVQFDALRTQSVGSVRPPSGPAMPTSGTGLAVDNRVDVDPAETTSQGDRDLKRAWRMMGQAINLSAGTSSSGMHQQRSILSHHAPTSPCPLQSPQLAASPIARTSFLPTERKNIDKPTHVASSRPSESSDAGTKRGLKEQLEAPSGRGKGLIGQPVLMDEERKQDHSSTMAPTKESCRTSESTGGKISADAVNIGNHGEKTDFSEGMEPQVVKLERNGSVRTYSLTGNGTDKNSVAHPKESNGTKSCFSAPHEDLKVHLIELVKKQTWPVYLAERLDKEQFKRIARAAVHSLLAVCDSSNNSLSSSCRHLEDHVNCSARRERFLHAFDEQEFVNYEHAEGHLLLMFVA